MTPDKTKTAKESTSISHYAIVETSGTQFWLESNRYYDLDRINAKVEETITLDKVILLNDEKMKTKLYLFDQLFLSLI